MCYFVCYFKAMTFDDKREPNPASDLCIVHNYWLPPASTARFIFLSTPSPTALESGICSSAIRAPHHRVFPKLDACAICQPKAYLKLRRTSQSYRKNADDKEQSILYLRARQKYRKHSFRSDTMQDLDIKVMVVSSMLL